ncbi:hypothetical protein KSP39_PZI019187 [Platanthera zijinensis]|uniref:Uncharacterized protein n=1 Tax=Platanthera zijinensis TaxID=2320716 RepID=A0AAP0FY04_9ASPA
MGFRVDSSAKDVFIAAELGERMEAMAIKVASYFYSSGMVAHAKEIGRIVRRLHSSSFSFLFSVRDKPSGQRGIHCKFI